MNDLTENQAQEEEGDKTQARQDYEAGQEQLKDNNYAAAAISFHNALIGFEQEGDEFGVANASDKLGVCYIGFYRDRVDCIEEAVEVITKPL